MRPANGIDSTAVHRAQAQARTVNQPSAWRAKQPVQREQAVEVTGLVAVCRALTCAYGPLRLDTADPSPRLRLARLWVGPVRFDRVRFGLDGRITVAEPGGLVLGHVTAGSVSYGLDGPPLR